MGGEGGGAQCRDGSRLEGAEQIWAGVGPPAAHRKPIAFLLTPPTQSATPVHPPTHLLLALLGILCGVHRVLHPDKYLHTHTHTSRAGRQAGLSVCWG